MNSNRTINILRKAPVLYKLLLNAKQLDDHKHLLAKIILAKIKTLGVLNDIKEAEFKVYSQFGDDGIIQYLIDAVKINKDEERFIEVGTEDYTESNTRFLLVNNNWSGLVIDADESAINFVKRDDVYWKHDLTAVAAFVTTENINRLISKNGFQGKVGLLSIDIDGNDYWVWKSINKIDPVIVVVEYNGTFGEKKAVTIPYQKTFSRHSAHYSGLYWGCSLKALLLAAQEKGYAFVGTNSAGNNAYFVKKERLNKLKPLTLAKGFTEPKFREARDKKGRLTFTSGRAKLALINEKRLYNIETGKLTKIKNLYIL